MRKYFDSGGPVNDTVNKQIKQDMGAHNQAYFMPFSVRSRMKAVSWLILLLFVALSSATTAVCLRIQQGIEAGNINLVFASFPVDGDQSTRQLYSYAVAGVLNALLIPVFSLLYRITAEGLTNWEKHRSDQSHLAALSTRLALFFFFNSNNSLFYIAFIKRDWFHLRAQVGSFILTGQIIGNIREVLIPFVAQRVRIWLASRSARQARAASQRWVPVVLWNAGASPLMCCVETCGNCGLRVVTRSRVVQLVGKRRPKPWHLPGLSLVIHTSLPTVAQPCLSLVRCYCRPLRSLASVPGTTQPRLQECRAQEEARAQVRAAHQAQETAPNGGERARGGDE